MSDTEAFDPAEHTVAEVEEYVTANPDQRDEVLAAEEAGKGRVTLIEWLEKGEDDDPHVEANVITTKTKDFMGRALVNIATNGVDYLGRPVVTGDKDFLGRALVT